MYISTYIFVYIYTVYTHLISVRLLCLRLPCRVHIYIYICLSNPALCQIVMLVKENPVLVDVSALEKCYQVMDLLCEQCVKQEDMNEVLAMKMHYISCILQKCLVFLQKCDDKLDALVKRWG